jgi:hypothetical protein
MSIFWNFFDSCAIRIEEITKLIYVIMDKKREHNGLTFLMGKKSDFLDRNIWTCDTQLLQKMHILVLATKTRNMHGVRTSFRDTLYEARHLHA